MCLLLISPFYLLIYFVIVFLFSQYSDSELWTVLDRCHLDVAVRKLGMLTPRNFGFCKRGFVAILVLL